MPPNGSSESSSGFSRKNRKASEYGPSAIDRKNNFGETALFMAAANGQADVLKALLAPGANANDTRGEGTSALRVASERKHIAAVQVLLGRGAAVN